MKNLREASEGDFRPDNSESHNGCDEIFRGPIDIRSISLTGIFLLLLFSGVYFARDFLLPIVLAFILSSLLAPAIRWLARMHIPAVLSSGLIIAGLLTVTVYGSYRLSEPAREWLQKAPGSFNTIRQKFRALLAPMEKARQTTKQIEKMAVLGKEDNVPTVQIQKPGLGDFVFSGTQRFLILAGLTIVLLYFLLASGDLFLSKLVRVLPTLEDKKRAVDICRQIEHDISTYLWTVTLVNIALGTAVGLALFFVGMPNPALWGVMAALLTYVPYLGPLTGIVSVGLASALTFNDPVSILLGPGIYFLLAMLEGNFITPMALGRSLSLKVVILIWLIFWGWAWGVIGAVLAVPLLAIVKIICDHFKPLSALSEFLGNEARAAYL